MKLTSEAAREQMFTRRTLFVGAATGGLGLLLAGRMAYLSIFEQEKYKLLAEDNRVSVRLIPPRRGWIVDRNGKPLAVNQPDYRLEMIPEQIADLEQTLADLTRLLRLPPEEVARIRDAAATQPKYLPIQVAAGISWNDFAAINVRLPDYDGVQPVRGFTRYYPDGDAVGHLLGYVGAPTREQYLAADRDPLYLHPAFKLGKDGIEKVLDVPLRGKAGARRVEVNARGRVIRELSTVNDTPGQTVKLTIALPSTKQDAVVTTPGGNASGLLAGGAPGGALIAGEALPVDQAYVFEAIAGGPDEVLVRFTMPKGYYLYRDKTAFRADNATLGAPRWHMISRVAYRAAKAGIVTGVLLAIARISGETAPLLFTALNNQFWSTDRNAPMASLPVIIFQFALSPYEDWRQLAWAGALLITAAVLTLSIAARALNTRR